MNNTRGTRQRKAIIYTRVSTDEQAEKGFSLIDQENTLKNYCKRENYEVVAHFKEDHSAKTFDRPEFQKMLSQIKAKTLKADLLLTVRCDRFSRNAELSFTMISELRKYGIEFNTVEQNIDSSTPEALLIKLLYFGMPQVENERRALNTTRGMRQAQKQGRWMATAPKGYSNIQRNGEKSIEPNEDAKHITWAFQQLSTGLYAPEYLRKQLITKGCVISKNQFYTLIRNPVYAGKIKIKEWRDEAEQIVMGLHQPIIDEDLFNVVQDILDGKKRAVKPHSLNDERFPLRGFLTCKKCGKPLTGSFSTGRAKIKYGYYHCQKKCKERYKLDEANKDFMDYLDNYQVKDEVLKLYYLMLQDVFKADKTERLQDVSRINKDIEDIKKRLDKSYDLYIDGNLSQSDYQKGTQRYEEEIHNLQSQKQELEFEETNFMETVKYSFGLLKDLPEYYYQSPIEVKQKILGSIFPEKLIYENKKYRTTQINKVLPLICENINELGEIKKGRIDNVNNSSCMVTPTGLKLVTF